MIGYKAFDKDLKCRGFQFEVGRVYEIENDDVELTLCTDTVFHFCRELHRIEAVSNYIIADSRVCEVIAEGKIVTDGDKYGTDKLRILREIPIGELQKYNNCNSGNRNSGGFLKTLQYKEAFKIAYEKAPKEEHCQLFALPNFSPKIFEKISGIDVKSEYKQWKHEQKKQRV